MGHERERTWRAKRDFDERAVISHVREEQERGVRPCRSRARTRRRADVVLAGALGYFFSGSKSERSQSESSIWIRIPNPRLHASVLDTSESLKPLTL
jgi:hypothetical protein